jgi:hypothetical protein
MPHRSNLGVPPRGDRKHSLYSMSSMIRFAVCAVIEAVIVPMLRVGWVLAGLSRALRPCHALSTVGQPLICCRDMLHFAAGHRQRQSFDNRTGLLGAFAPMIRVVALFHVFPRYPTYIPPSFRNAEGINLVPSFEQP